MLSFKVTHSHSLTHSLTHSANQRCNRTHSLTHSLTHSFAESCATSPPTHSLTHSLLRGQSILLHSPPPRPHANAGGQSRLLRIHCRRRSIISITFRASAPTRKRRRSIKTITKWEQTAGSVNQTINFYGKCVREFRSRSIKTITTAVAGGVRSGQSKSLLCGVHAHKKQRRTIKTITNGRRSAAFKTAENQSEVSMWW